MITGYTSTDTAGGGQSRIWRLRRYLSWDGWFPECCGISITDRGVRAARFSKLSDSKLAAC